MIPRSVIQSWAVQKPSPTLHVGITAALSEANLREKLNDSAFRTDLNALVTEWPEDYDIDDAAELVIAEVLSNI